MLSLQRYQLSFYSLVIYNYYTLKLLLNQSFSCKMARGRTSFRLYKQRLNRFALSLFLHQNPLTLIFHTKRKLINHSPFFYSLG
jgi:hypothetical protein